MGNEFHLFSTRLLVFAEKPDVQVCHWLVTCADNGLEILLSVKSMPVSRVPGTVRSVLPPSSRWNRASLARPCCSSWPRSGVRSRPPLFLAPQRGRQLTPS